MVKVGFICEGSTELILLQSDSFNKLLASLNIKAVGVINAKGSGNLLPHNIAEYVALLEKDEAETIIILTDLDEEFCVTRTKERIKARNQDIIVVAVKEIEAWFLACDITMQELLNDPGFHFSAPENEKIPFETINYLLVKAHGRGIGKKGPGKIKLINKLLEIGLDLSQAAVHPKCPSAKYFLKKLKEAGTKRHVSPDIK